MNKKWINVNCLKSHEKISMSVYIAQMEYFDIDVSFLMQIVKLSVHYNANDSDEFERCIFMVILWEC